MYSSMYGPPSGRQYIGRDSNNYRAYSANADYSSLASATVGGSPSSTRRYEKSILEFEMYKIGGNLWTYRLFLEVSWLIIYILFQKVEIPTYF